MKITLKRIAKKDTYTIGKLYIDDIYFCDALEDKDRCLNGDMSEEEIIKIKVKGETAIPTGIYNISITYSHKFKRDMPLIENVKGFAGIRIHAGNTDKDSEGCILVGENKVIGKVINSRNTYNKLFNRLVREKNKITIEIK
jgi:hypothetical protein